MAGIVVCAHCGAKMSAFLHTDRYKLADGTIREKVQAKYNCYQRGQKLRACDGQSLYLAERVDAVVLEVVHDIFRRIQQEPYDRSIEQKLRQENGERERQKQAAEKKIKAAQYKQKRYEDEVIRCLDGQSRFSEEMLARLIAEAETEVRQAKEEYAELLRNDTTRATIQQIRSYYDEFLGWANEFDLATIPRKRGKGVQGDSASQDELCAVFGDRGKWRNTSAEGRLCVMLFLAISERKILAKA